MASQWPKHQQRLRQAALKKLSSATSSKPSLLPCSVFALVAAIALLWLIFYWGSGSSSAHDSLVDQGVARSNLKSAPGSGDSRQVCDYSKGRWVYDPHREAAYNESCTDIFKGWNCIKNHRKNAGSYLRWKWQPDDCDLPRLNPEAFLKRMRGKRIGFVGDSLNRNMYSSLVCNLRQASDKEVKKWRPVGSDKGITFLKYNVTVGYHRTNLLARYGEWKASDGGPLEKLGFRQGYRVDVDVPQSTWIEAPKFYDILIISTGHWWFAPEKFDPATSPMLFFEKGKPLVPPKSPEEGLDITLKHMLHFIDQYMREGGLKFLRTQSPRHFEGGDWKDGGKCHRSKPLNSAEVEGMFSPARKGVNSEVRLVNDHLLRSVSANTSFRLLNITHMSEFRADGHPSTSAKKLHEDCMHWCLPGVTDLWNDILAALILESTI